MGINQRCGGVEFVDELGRSFSGGASDAALGLPTASLSNPRQDCRPALVGAADKQLKKRTARQAPAVKPPANKRKTAMKHFTDEFRAFFRDLAKNNNKKWFDANRKRYEHHVKQPFADFVRALITELATHDSAFAKLLPKDAIGRINRDTRFAKDKTPYNIFVNAILTPGGRKEMGKPGIALRLGDGIWVGGGSYMPSKEKLQAIRERIRDETDEFQKLLKARRFKSRFGEIQGDAHKRIPKEFQDTFEREPLIARKQFYYTAELDGQILTSAKLTKTIMQYWEAAKPMNEFLNA